MAWDVEVREKVYQRLANEIFFRIYDGTYQFGAKLPTYQAIAQEAGTSLETVFKAVRTLREYGLIEKTRWGNFITSDNEKVLAYREQYVAITEKLYREAMNKITS